MNAYKDGRRKHDVMKTFAAGVSDSDLSNMALFYALQTARADHGAQRSSRWHCRDRLQRMPWRKGSQLESGDTKPRRARRRVPRGCHARLQGWHPDRRSDEKRDRDARQKRIAISPPTTPRSNRSS